MDWSEKSIIIVVQSGSWNRDFFLTCGLFLSRTHTHTVPSHIFFIHFVCTQYGRTFQLTLKCSTAKTSIDSCSEGMILV